MKKIPFLKMTGAGNDFVLIDNRKKILSRQKAQSLAKRILSRGISVGGDGLILLEPSRKGNFRWSLFNPDGSEGEISGNGGRCAARAAYLLGIASRVMSFETRAGIVRAEVKDSSVILQFPDPGEARLALSIPLDGETREGDFINTGVPHLVLFVPDVEQVDVAGVGRKIRYHPLFHPAGTNVNFVQVRNSRRLLIRTYERGVEDETLACGSGAVAAALVSAMRGMVRSPVRLITRGGRGLVVHFKREGGRFSPVFLEGEARVIYEGEMWEEAWT